MLSPAAEAISVRPSHHRSAREAAAPMAIEDWRLVRAERVNALIVGPAGLVDAVLAQELPPAGFSEIGWSETGELEITDVSPVIVIREVHELSRARQQRVLDWLARHPALQVISTATSEVYPLVLDGRFLAELYYRLNVFSFFLQD